MRPGFSGLYFTMDNAATCDERETLGSVKRTFGRLGANRWIYLGQYEFAPGVSLTAAFWTEQSIQVRYVYLILDSGSFRTRGPTLVMFSCWGIGDRSAGPR